MRVLVADNDADFRDLLREIVESEPSLTLVGVASDDEEALRLARESTPDVVLLDVQLLGEGGVGAARQIRQVCPAARILALSGTRDRQQVIAMMRAGAAGYLVKAATPGEILRMLTDATSDNVTVSGVSANVLIDPSDPKVLEETLQIQSLLKGEHTHLVVQPIFDLQTSEIVGYEALARFELEPRAGPDVWFKRADKAGLRADLEFAVLGTALPLATSIPDGTFLGVNLSPSAVVSDNCETAFWNSAPDRLVVEMTEHLPVLDYPQMRNRLAALRAMGIRIAIDDVGAGFASLRHILELAPDYIKMDTSLTRHIDHDSPRRALAEALVYFAKELGASVVAEGVETKAELQVLKELGVRYAQGFYLARPGPFVGPSPSAEPAGRISELVDAAVAAVAGAKTAPLAMEALGSHLSPHLPLDHVSLRVFTPPNRMTLVALWDEGKTSIGPGVSSSVIATPFPEVVRRDGPVASSDFDVYHPLVERMLHEDGIRSWVSIPLHRPGGTPSMLSFGSRRLDAFDEVRIDVVARIGSAVERALLQLLEATS